MRIQDVAALLPGGGGGMGRHFALRLASAGAKVVVGDVDESAALMTAEAGPPGQLKALHVDVRDEESIGRFVDQAADWLGRPNVLINTAAIVRDAPLVTRHSSAEGGVHRLERDRWQEVIDVNLTGATLMVRDFCVWVLDHEVRPAVVINLSSIARRGNRGQSSYVAAKSALAANTRTWAQELGHFGIRVGAVAPGMIDTPMLSTMIPRVREQLKNHIPLGRIGQAEDVWQAVRFILECEYFTGSVVDVDGGLTL